MRAISPGILSCLASVAAATLASAGAPQSPEAASPSPNPTATVSDEFGRFTLRPPQKHPGAQDGSAGVALDGKHFVGATDEDNILLLYSAESEEPGAEFLDLNKVLG